MIGVIIQARMGSTRLPNKIMQQIDGKPLLAYCIERVKQAKYVDKVIIATTDNKTDDVVYEWCMENDILCFRGSEQNVLDRYYQAATKYQLNTVVRVTSDCPFVDPRIVDMLITTLLCQRSDYVSNRWKQRSWPHGLDVEVMNMKSLEKAWQCATADYEKEHVTPYILEHEEIFDIIEVPYYEDLSQVRLTVDYLEDMDMVQKVLPILYSKHGVTYHWKDIIATFEEYPQLKEINALVGSTKLY